MPIGRADYFDNPRSNAPSRSVIIVAGNESDALNEARSKMGSLCARAEVIPLEVTAQPSEPSRLRSVLERFAHESISSALLRVCR
jgi:hypothetical protein